MLRQSKNVASVEGQLVENGLKPIDYKKTINGVEQEVQAIGGTLTVRVHQKFEKDGEPKELDIEVHTFANKITNAGAENPAYLSLKKAMEKMSSLAVVDDPEDADYIRITGTNVGMNEYHKNGALVSFPRIRGSFVNKVELKDLVEKGKFDVDVYIQSISDEVDKEGDVTGRVKVMGVIVQYGGVVDLVPFYIENEKIADAFQQYFQVGDTVPLTGVLNFTSTNETILKENVLGEDTEEVVTRRVSELVITGAGNAKEGDAAFEPSDIKDGLALRQARLEKDKEKANNQGSSTSAPSEGSTDVGF